LLLLWQLRSAAFVEDRLLTMNTPPDVPFGAP
jgi:hypothetical protein